MSKQRHITPNAKITTYRHHRPRVERDFTFRGFITLVLIIGLAAFITGVLSALIF